MQHHFTKFDLGFQDVTFLGADEAMDFSFK